MKQSLNWSRSITNKTFYCRSHSVCSLVRSWSGRSSLAPAAMSSSPPSNPSLSSRLDRSVRWHGVHTLSSPSPMVFMKILISWPFTNWKLIIHQSQQNLSCLFSPRVQAIRLEAVYDHTDDEGIERLAGERWQIPGPLLFHPSPNNVSFWLDQLAMPGKTTTLPKKRAPLMLADPQNIIFPPIT